MRGHIVIEQIHYHGNQGFQAWFPWIYNIKHTFRRCIDDTAPSSVLYICITCQMVQGELLDSHVVKYLQHQEPLHEKLGPTIRDPKCSHFKTTS